MEMQKINEKLKTFETIVIKDATQKVGSLVNQAEMDRQGMEEEKEIECLKEAYQRIQEAKMSMIKESNAAYSGKLLEVKQVLFTKRTQIIEAVFKEVDKKLESYIHSPDYRAKLKGFIEKGIKEVGQGEIIVMTDKKDIPYAEKTVNAIKGRISIQASDTVLDGGCIIINRTKGVLADYSFKNRLKKQREAFLRDSGMNVDF